MTTHGKVLEYIVMMLDYTNKGKVKISMHEYIDIMHAELPSDMDGAVQDACSITFIQYRRRCSGTMNKTLFGISGIMCTNHNNLLGQ